MRDKSFGFVTKAFEYTKQYPEFARLNIDEFVKDINTLQTLRELLMSMAQLNIKLDGSILVAGSEDYTLP